MEKTAVVLPMDWFETERGNTMVVQDDGAIAAWIHIRKNVYLEITDTPGNYPRLSVTFVESTPDKLSKEIREKCEGWFCVRWNVDDKAPTDEKGYICAETVVCKLCGEDVPSDTAHFHDGGWVGDECCWDERLRTTE